MVKEKQPEIVRKREMQSQINAGREVRALNWKQPYLHLMQNGIDKVETRTWKTDFRGLVLMCASQSPYQYNIVRSISGQRQTGRIMQLLPAEGTPRGQALFIGELIDCVPMHPKDENACFVAFNPDLWCHVYGDVFPIDPFPWKGRQKWKVLDDSIKSMIKIQGI